MQTTFDKMKWPELTEFRQACLDDDYETMGRIADRGHHWYKNENPNGVELETLAKSYQAQYAASVGDLAKLQELKELAPMALVSPWTAQKWLPISQAACSHGDREIIDFLITNGADPRAIVGSEDDQATVVEMAKFGKNKDLPAYLEGIIQRGTFPAA